MIELILSLLNLYTNFLYYLLTLLYFALCQLMYLLYSS